MIGLAVASAGPVTAGWRAVARPIPALRSNDGTTGSPAGAIASEYFRRIPCRNRSTLPDRSQVSAANPLAILLPEPRGYNLPSLQAQAMPVSPPLRRSAKRWSTSTRWQSLLSSSALPATIFNGRIDIEFHLGLAEISRLTLRSNRL